MEVDNAKVGQGGRFYLTKHIWVPQKPIENFNLRMSDMILRRMPKMPIAGDEAFKAFPVLNELRKDHDKIKADLQYLLSHHEEIPTLTEVHPRDLFVPGRAWRTFMLKIWGHEIKANTAAVADTYAAINRIPGVHSALFSILAGGAELMPHRGSAAGVVRFHYPLIVPKEPEKCWIEIGNYHFYWQEGVPLVFDDTREHWVKNQTKETRVVLIVERSGKIRFIAVAASQRDKLYPDVPCTAEMTALKGYEVNGWAGLFAPRSAPAPVRAQLAADLAEVLKSPVTRERYAAMGYEVPDLSADAFGNLIVRETDTWAGVIRTASLHLD